MLMVRSLEKVLRNKQDVKAHGLRAKVLGINVRFDKVKLSRTKNFESKKNSFYTTGVPIL